jgi:signal transduction histidine kinase
VEEIMAETPRHSPTPGDPEARIANRARLRRILQRALIHDLKAPLNTATLLIDLLGRSLETKGAHEEAEHNLATVEEVRRELRRLTDALPFLLSLPDPGDEAPLVFDWVPKLNESLDLLRQQVLLRGARLVRRFPPQPVFLMARPSDHLHAALNLVLNAIEAAPRGSQVEISMELADSAARFSVLDRGPGLPPELGLRVLEPRVTTRDGRDGLGLSVAQAILAEYGGTLRLLPRDGGGTVASLEFPVTAAPAVANPALFSPAVTSSPTGPESR